MLAVHWILFFFLTKLAVAFTTTCNLKILLCLLPLSHKMNTNLIYKSVNVDFSFTYLGNFYVVAEFVDKFKILWRNGFKFRMFFFSYLFKFSPETDDFLTFIFIDHTNLITLLWPYYPTCGGVGSLKKHGKIYAHYSKIGDNMEVVVQNEVGVQKV